MQTKEALRRLGGKTHSMGDAMSRLAPKLARQQEERQRALFDRAGKAQLRQAAPFQQVLDRHERTAARDELQQGGIPVCTRADLARIASEAYRDMTTDRGLKRLAGMANVSYQEDPHGFLTVASIAEMRNAIEREFGRSAALDVLGEGIARIAFSSTLPTRRLAQVASEIQGSNDHELQASYHAAVERHALQGQDARSVQARAFIRGLVELQAETGQNVHRVPTGEEALSRALNRYAQMMEEEPDMGDLDMGPAMMGEELDEPEVIEFESPLTGEELELELRSADPMDDMGTEEFGDDELAEMAFVGQIDDMNLMDDGAIVEEVEDPSAPGEMLRLTVEPVETESFGPGDDGMMDPMGSGEPLPMMGLEASRGDGQRTYYVYAVRNGRKQAEPMLMLRDARMRGALAQLHGQIGQTDQPISILAGRGGFAREALAVLDAPSKTYFLVQAEDLFDVGEIKQQVVEHNVSIPSDGAEVLTSDSPNKQNAPKEHESGREARIQRAARPLTKAQIAKVCQSFGLSASGVLDRLLNGEKVVGPRFASGWALDTDDAGNVVLSGPGARKRAAITHAEVLIEDWMARVASMAYQTAPEPESVDIEFRPLFRTICASCGDQSEYLMPDEPIGVRCGSCGYETDPDAVGHQFRAAPFYTGWVITAEVPLAGGPERFVENAKRMVRAVQKIVPHVEADLRPEHADLQMIVRGASEAHLGRIRRVLEDLFGVQRLVAQDLGIEEIPDAEMSDMGNAEMPMTASAPEPEWTGYRPSKRRRAQMPPVAPGAPVADIAMDPLLTPMDAPIPQGEPGMPMLDMFQVEDPLSSEQIEKVEAAFTYFRSTGKGILDALDELVRTFSDMLDAFGPEGSPTRSAAEIQIAEMALDAYEKPAITAGVRKVTASEKARVKRRIRRAQSRLTLPSANTQQPDAVPGIGKGDKVLGPDSTGDEPSVFNVKPKNQPNKNPQGGSSEWNPESESESRDPGDFGAGKPEAHNSTIERSKGTKAPSTDMGSDSSTGENPLSRKMDELSSGAKAQPNKR